MNAVPPLGKCLPLVLLAFVVLVFQQSIVLAQGSLTPPGAPAPMMKSLDQIEPRTPISSVPFVITNSGSYYLVSNLNLAVNTNAITISANDVTLDLRGFTIGTSVLRGTGSAILLNGGNTDITIYNGHITGGTAPYFASGVTYSGASPLNTRVANVSVTECFSVGINVGTNASTLVEGCTVQAATGYGIEAGQVSFSSAYQCGQTAIAAATIAFNCTASSVNGDGIDALVANSCSGSAAGGGQGVYANAANNCYAYSASGLALVAFTANNCYGGSSTGDGVFAESAMNCAGVSPGGTGIAGIVAIGCYSTGGGGSGGVGLDASIAESCSANTEIGINWKLNMP